MDFMLLSSDVTNNEGGGINISQEASLVRSLKSSCWTSQHITRCRLLLTSMQAEQLLI